MHCLASIDSNGWDEGEIGRSRELADVPGHGRRPRARRAHRRWTTSTRRRSRLAGERAHYDDWGYRSMVSLPLVVEGRPVGLVDLFDTRPRDWTELLDFIRNVGRLLGGAFDKAVLLDQLEKGNSELRLLVQSGLDFGATLDHDAVIDTVARRIREISGADICDVYALEGGRGRDPHVRRRRRRGRRQGAALHDRRLLHVPGGLRPRAPGATSDILSDPRATPDRSRRRRGVGLQRRRPTSRSSSRARSSASCRSTATSRVTSRRWTRSSAWRRSPRRRSPTRRLYRQLDDNVRRLSLLTESALELTSTLDLEDVLTRLAWRLCRAVDVPDCEIHVIEGDDLVSVMSLTEGIVDREWIGFHLPLREAGVTQEVDAHQAPDRRGLARRPPRLRLRTRAQSRRRSAHAQTRASAGSRCR